MFLFYKSGSLVSVLIYLCIIPLSNTQSYYEDEVPKDYVEPLEYSDQSSFGTSLGDLRLKRENIVPKNYGENCKTSSDCNPTSQLDCLGQKCQCRFPQDMLFDSVKNSCVLLAGASCNTIQLCVDNAGCSNNPSKDGSDYVCRCDLQFYETPMRTCNIQKVQIPDYKEKSPSGLIITAVNEESQSKTAQPSPVLLNKSTILKVEPVQQDQLEVPEKETISVPEVEMKNQTQQELELSDTVVSSETASNNDDLIDTMSENTEIPNSQLQDVSEMTPETHVLPEITESAVQIANVSTVGDTKGIKLVDPEVSIIKLKLGDECRLNKSENCPSNSTCSPQKNNLTMICKCNDGFVSNPEVSGCGSVLPTKIINEIDSLQEKAVLGTSTTNPLLLLATTKRTPNYPVGSKVGETCLHDLNPLHAEAVQCIKNADCVHVPDYFKEYGMCRCKDGYFKTIKQLCRKQPVSSATSFSNRDSLILLVLWPMSFTISFYFRV